MSTHHASSTPHRSAGCRRGFLILLLGISLPGVAASAGEPAPRFVDVARRAGIDFEHFAPPTEQRHTHLVMGGGAGWLDYDRDGAVDLYLGQGADWPQTSAESGCLYRGRGEGGFRDATAAAGLQDPFYSMGVAVGDRNNDGFPDLYVSAFGRNRLYANNGDGTFSEIGGMAGVAGTRYSASCTWADINADGIPDLYVSNYLDIDPQNYQLCSEPAEGREVFFICHPQTIAGVYDVLYEAQADGTYHDISESAGLRADPPRQGLGVVAADLDDDNDLDFYVANDTVPNQLWENLGQGRFVSSGLLSGTALNRDGNAEAGMGIAVGDVTGDGRPDLFVTNYFAETNTLYRNEGHLQFWDVTAEFRLGSPSRMRLGFGASLLDIENDSRLDLFVANGHVNDRLHLFGRDEPFAQRALLFRNSDQRTFADVSEVAGPYFLSEVVGRGSAVADFDRDGRQDILVQHLNARPSLLRNETEQAGAWLRLKLIGTGSNRDAAGARIEIVDSEPPIVRWRTSSSSYLCSDESVLTIGLGAERPHAALRIRWPSGVVQTWQAVPTGQAVALIEVRDEFYPLADSR